MNGWMDAIVTSPPLLPPIPFQPCPNNERQTHHADDNTATGGESYSHVVPASSGGGGGDDRRNRLVNPGYAANNFARRNVKKLLSAYRWGQS